jgi:hypothetical protein
MATATATATATADMILVFILFSGRVIPGCLSIRKARTPIPSFLAGLGVGKNTMPERPSGLPRRELCRELSPSSGLPATFCPRRDVDKAGEDAGRRGTHAIRLEGTREVRVGSRRARLLADRQQWGRTTDPPSSAQAARSPSPRARPAFPMLARGEGARQGG